MSIGDSLQRQRAMSRSSILDELDSAPRAPEASPGDRVSNSNAKGHLPDAEELALLPRPGDDYKAFSRPDRKMVPTLRLLAGSPRARGFAYSNLQGVDLEEDDTDGGAVIVMLFAGLRPVEVRIAGRNLDKLYDLLSYERISWVWQLPGRRDFRGANEAVVTGITVRRIE